jgi:hypothetical protein
MNYPMGNRALAAVACAVDLCAYHSAGAEARAGAPGRMIINVIVIMSMITIATMIIMLFSFMCVIFVALDIYLST